MFWRDSCYPIMVIMTEEHMPEYFDEAAAPYSRWLVLTNDRLSRSGYPGGFHVKFAQRLDGKFKWRRCV